MLTSSKKNETAVHGCNPTISVLVVLVSHKVYLLCSTISLAVLFVIYHFHADQIPCSDPTLAAFSFAVPCFKVVFFSQCPLALSILQENTLNNTNYITV